MRKLLPLFFLFTACAFGPGNFHSRQSADIESRRIKRIAVLPQMAMPADMRSKVPYAAALPADAKPSEREAPEILAKLLYSAMLSMPQWQIVSDSEVREVGQGVAIGDEAARLRRVGELVYADAVLAGRVLRYRERVGEEWGVKSPASVAFVVDLLDVRRGDIAWSARFDETQKSLSENIFALGEITRRGVRWLSAEELTSEGVQKAVNQLHQALFRQPS